MIKIHLLEFPPPPRFFAWINKWYIKRCVIWRVFRSPPIFAKICRKFSEINRTARGRSLLTFSAIYVPIIFVLWVNFGPEYPQWAIFFDSFGYALVIATMVFVHNHKFDFINSDSMNESAYIERIQSEHKTWLYTSLSLTGIFILFRLIMYMAFQFLPRQYTNNPTEQLLLFNSFLADLFLGIVLAIFSGSEFFRKVQSIQIC